MRFEESSDDSEDERKLKLTIKQEIEDSLQLNSKTNSKGENGFNHSNQDSHHYDRNITNDLNTNKVYLKPSKLFWPMVKGISIGSNEIADLRLYPFPACAYQYCENDQEEISANLIGFKIKLPMCSHEELLEELKIFKIERPSFAEDTKVEAISTKNGSYKKNMNHEKYTPYYLKLKELNLRKDVIFKNILRKIKKDFRIHFNETTNYLELKKIHGVSVLMKCIEDYLTKILSLKFNKELGFAMGIFVNSRDIQLLINNRNETLEEPKTKEDISNEQQTNDIHECLYRFNVIRYKKFIGNQNVRNILTCYCKLPQYEHIFEHEKLVVDKILQDCKSSEKKSPNNTTKSYLLKDL